MIHFNLGSHDGRTIEELTSLVEVTERAAFTTSSAAALTRSDSLVGQLENGKHTSAGSIPAPITVSNQSDPQIHLPVAASPESERVLLASAPTQSQPLSETFIPKILSPEEIEQADDAFHFDLRSDFDETEFEEEADER